MVHKQPRRFTLTIEFEDQKKSLHKKLLKAISNHRSGIEDYSSERQLEKIIYEIDEMILVNSAKEFTPSFPRMIVDSWEFNNQLGIELLQFFELYKKVK